MSKYHVDPHGYYGRFGGAYIPEMLHANIEDLSTVIEITFECNVIRNTVVLYLPDREG